MCLAALALDGAQMDESEIRRAWSSNSDGGGLAYFDANNKVRAFRTLSLSKFLRGYDRILSEAAPGAPMAIHFRLATHGSKGIGNVHPFTQNANTMVAHNGMFPFEGVGDQSDTALFVGEMLPRLGDRWFDDPYLFHLVEAYCDAGYTNKLVVVTSDPDANERAYLVNERAGNWNASKTIWFSNRSHEPRGRTTQKATTNSWVNLPNEDWNACAVVSDNDGWTRCAFCDELGVTYLDETGTLVCHICGTCEPCGAEWDDCECYGSIHRLTDAQLALRPI